MSKGKTKEKMRLRALKKAMLAIIELKELEDTASQITFSHHDTYKTLVYRKEAAAIVPWKPKHDAKITTVDKFRVFQVPPPPTVMKATFVEMRSALTFWNRIGFVILFWVSKTLVWLLPGLALLGILLGVAEAVTYVDTLPEAIGEFLLFHIWRVPAHRMNAFVNQEGKSRALEYYRSLYQPSTPPVAPGNMLNSSVAPPLFRLALPCSLYWGRG